MHLPKEFVDMMRGLLGSEFAAFEQAFQSPCLRGLRINPIKWDRARLSSYFPNCKNVGFLDDGFYLTTQEKLGNHPLHHAGAFYLQEPSAMTAVAALSPQPGDFVLDLCAAPGGKATALAVAAGDTGLLWANEIVAARARVLLSNIERLGIRNAVVSQCHPAHLCGALRGFFDRVLVDAPCSGEGMFRKESDALAQWSTAYSEACAARQLKILDSAALALRPGGYLCYSTCTFSPEENERVLAQFLRSHKAFSLVPIQKTFGRPALGRYAPDTPSIELARRILPMDGGEGQFVALLRRAEDEPIFGGRAPLLKSNVSAAAQALWNSFWSEQFDGETAGTLWQRQSQLFLLPSVMPQTEGVPILRAGLYCGQLCKDRFEPSHALYAAGGLAPRRTLNLQLDDPSLGAFLRGEEIPLAQPARGYLAVQVEGVPLSFGKSVGITLKNHYPKGRRML